LITVGLEQRLGKPRASIREESDGHKHRVTLLVEYLRNGEQRDCVCDVGWATSVGAGPGAQLELDGNRLAWLKARCCRGVPAVQDAGEGVIYRRLKSAEGSDFLPWSAVDRDRICHEYSAPEGLRGAMG